MIYGKVKLKLQVLGWIFLEELNIIYCVSKPEKLLKGSDSKSDHFHIFWPHSLTFPYWHEIVKGGQKNSPISGIDVVFCCHIRKIQSNSWLRRKICLKYKQESHHMEMTAAKLSTRGRLDCGCY